MGTRSGWGSGLGPRLRMRCSLRMAATSTTFRDVPRTHIVLVRLDGSLVVHQRGSVNHQVNDRSLPWAAQCPQIRGRGIKCQ